MNAFSFAVDREAATSGPRPQAAAFAGSYQPHPLAELFPPIEDEAYWDLVEDIRVNGVREPVVMLDGMVLDGRNRYLAARECGAQVPTVQYDGDDPLAYIISLNLKRRHLSESQRALVASKLANMRQGERTDLPSIDGKSVSQAQAAAMLNVGVASVERARSVQEHGDPGLVAQVNSGAVSVSAAAQVARLPSEDQREIVDAGPEAIREAAKDIRRSGAAHRGKSRNDEWYTPAAVVALAREVLGGIDLDPASNELAQRTVAAAEFFTKQDDGLKHTWRGRVWCNPPYSQPLIANFTDKLVTEFEAGNVTAAILLTNNCTDTTWFQKAAKAATAICFTRGRIRFENPVREDAGTPEQGQSIFYFGPDLPAFERAFHDMGFIVEVRG